MFLRIPLLQIQNNFCYRFAISNKHQILSTHFDETFCGNLVNNFDCRAFRLFETVTGSRIIKINLKTNSAILWYTQAWIIRPLQIHNNFQNSLAVSNKHRSFIRFERSFLSLLVSFRFGYEYQIEYEYDFRISNQ